MKLIRLQKEITVDFLNGSTAKEIADKYELPLSHVDATIRLVCAELLNMVRTNISVKQIMDTKQFLLRRLTISHDYIAI